MTMIRVLIVDDEPPARRKVHRFLAQDPEVEVVGEAGSGGEAVQAIRREAPDLVFLDVQMPDFDGFDVLEASAGGAVGASERGAERSGGPGAGDAAEPDVAMPHVIFVTAYDEYALRAFDVHAVDYLLKPFDPGRFETALERAKSRIRLVREAGVGSGAAALDAGGGAAASTGLDRLLRELRGRTAYLERLLVEARGRIFFVKLDTVDWIEAERNYVRLHVGPESYLVRGTLTALQDRLDPARFARVHRSHTVNLDRIQELIPWSHGEFIIVLRDGTRLPVSRRYRDRLPHLFGKQF